MVRSRPRNDPPPKGRCRPQVRLEDSNSPTNMGLTCCNNPVDVRLGALLGFLEENKSIVQVQNSFQYVSVRHTMRSKGVGIALGPANGEVLILALSQRMVALHLCKLDMLCQSWLPLLIRTGR